MLALSWPCSLGFIVNAPAPAGAFQPTLVMQRLVAPYESPTVASLVFPSEQVSFPFPTTMLAEEAYITTEFDAAFGLAIPVLFGGLLFAFYKLLKLFASAF